MLRDPINCDGLHIVRTAKFLTPRLFNLLIIIIKIAQSLMSQKTFLST